MLLAPQEKSFLLQHEISSEDCCFGFICVVKVDLGEKVPGSVASIFGGGNSQKKKKILDLGFLPRDSHNSENV